MSSQLAPATADGWATLHQYVKIDWNRQAELLRDVYAALEPWSNPSEDGQSAVFSVFGHKADLLILHYRKSFDLLATDNQRLGAIIHKHGGTQSYSFLATVEMGLYRSTVSALEILAKEGLTLETPEGDARYAQVIKEQSQNPYVQGRLWTKIPDKKYVSFYPMNKKREAGANWYSEDVQLRAKMMLEHGEKGRKYSGRVEQVISGSIGFDEWEWGVDLFCDDPLVVKELVYEMRFDEGSAKYAEFGDFLFAKRLKHGELLAT